MKTYTHLSYEERLVIRVLKSEGRSLREIARELCRAPSTISRELKRNEQFKGHRVIYPHFAQMKANGRRQRAYRKPRLKSKELQRHVVSKLELGWSPEQISGRMKQQGFVETVSHEAIYQYIYKQRPDLIDCLTRKHRKRWRRGQTWKRKGYKIKERTPISERPQRVNSREEFGHWESDLAVSQTGQQALQAIVERKSRYVKLSLVQDRKAHSASTKIVKRLSTLPKKARQTITYDNGHENTLHMRVNQKLDMQSYFCDPYSPWQRGTVENTFSLVRRVFPKKTKFAEMSLQELKLLERHLNHRPRKCLQFRTPVEVFNEECVALQC